MANGAESKGFTGWARSHLPTRETIQHNRFLRPFAKQLSQPNLWHFNHRSVPRGVALGLGVGVIIPVMHIVVAAVLAIPTRANVLLAAAFTLLVNPLTMSGYAEEQLRKSIDIDNVAFLPKPFSVQELAEAVRQVLAEAAGK